MYSKRVDSYGDGPYPRTSPWLAAGMQSIVRLVEILLKDPTLTFDCGSLEVVQDGIEVMLSAGLNESLAQVRAECKLFLYCIVKTVPS